MKKYTLNFGEFKQYDKVFLTEEKGVNPQSVTSLAFEGESLYMATAECLYEYAGGALKKHNIKATKLFAKGGKLYAAIKNSLAEIKKGKAKKIADLDSPVVDMSVALDGSMWLITKENLYLYNGEEFTEIVGLPAETVCVAALDNKAKYAETEKPKIKIREGKAVIIAKPKEDYMAEVLHTFWVAQCGAHVLACNYPDFVSLNHLTV